MKKFFCKDLKAGDSLIKETFSIRQIIEGEKFSFYLSDRTGSIEAVLVEDSLTDIELIKSNIGGVFEVTGPVLSHSTNNGQINIVKVKTISLATNFLANEVYAGISPEIRDAHIGEIRKAQEKVGDTSFKALLDALLTNENLMKLSLCPASHRTYGVYVGGALVSTSVPCWMLMNSVSAYIRRGNGISTNEHKTDWDLLITAALLHQIAKIRYYDEANPYQKSLEGVALNYYTTLVLMIEEAITKNGIEMDTMRKANLLNALHVTVSGRTDTMASTKEASALRSVCHLFRELDGFDWSRANHNFKEGEEFYYDDKLERYIFAAAVEDKGKENKDGAS